EISGQNLTLCMQCGTCSSSCTGKELMDLLPRKIMRMIQTGNAARALECRSIWTCSTCLLCTAHCPRGIDVACVMEALRTVHLRERGEILTQKNIPEELLKEIPQMALIGVFRKFSS
ncbi:MAG: 4Fe-4S dicluster domain-containing protein, partial [Eubacteriales bacterium]